MLDGFQITELHDVVDSRWSSSTSRECSDERWIPWPISIEVKFLSLILVQKSIGLGLIVQAAAGKLMIEVVWWFWFCEKFVWEAGVLRS